MSATSKYLLAAAISIVGISAAASEVRKCIVDGKTTYSNQGCPSGAVSQPIEMYPGARSILPARQTANDAPEHARPKKRVEAEPGRSATRIAPGDGKTHPQSYQHPLPLSANAPTGNKKYLCEALLARSKRLESKALQPQSPNNLEWIRGEKAKTQTEIFKAQC